MIPNIARKIHDLVSQEIHQQVNAAANHQARLTQGMRFFPQVLTVDTTIPEGRQLVLDRLTVADGVTLTVVGHLRVLSGVLNQGNIEITSTGSFYYG